MKPIVFIVAAALCVMLPACTQSADRPDNAAALADIKDGRRGDEVVVEGPVTRVYPPSTGESGTHERFDIEIRSGAVRQNIFVADNITVGELAPVKPGDDVVVKGVLELDASGPVIHWTHHDPQFRHASGYVELAGKKYD